MKNRLQVILTGATGFIGSSFVEYLIKKNVIVLALGRRSLEELPSHTLQKIHGATYLQVDMSCIGTLSQRLKDINWSVDSSCTFFNLAWGGVSTLSDLDIQAQFNNTSWAVAAVEIAKEIGCKTFVQVGTMEEAFTYKYLELDHNINNEYNRHVIYSVAKIAAKNATKIKAKQLGLDYIYVLHSHVMGPYDSKDSFLQVTLQKLLNGDELIFSSGEQIFDVISVQDCAIGYYLICRNGVPGSEYWVGSGTPKPLREYIERMYKILPSDKKMQFGKLPYNDIVLEESVFSTSQLAEHTGYVPTMSYEETVLDLYHFFLKMNANGKN